MSASPSRWNEPAQVERFAARDPDLRLVALLPGFPSPSSTRALDLGCAGGRNTELLARRAFDVYALDLSTAMVARTRTRLAALLGEAEAQARVVQGPMTDLSMFGTGSFDLVVALGIYHQAASEEEWFEALAETARVVAPGGRVLVSNFAPGTVFSGQTVHRIEGKAFLHASPKGGTLCLREQEGLEGDFARLGFVTEVPTVRVEREDGDSRRITLNALFSRSA